jgi:hypothetical protein
MANAIPALLMIMILENIFLSNNKTIGASLLL